MFIVSGPSVDIHSPPTDKVFNLTFDPWWTSCFVGDNKLQSRRLRNVPLASPGHSGQFQIKFTFSPIMNERAEVFHPVI